MKRLNFSTLLQNVKDGIRLFPMEAAAGVVFFIINLVYLSWDYDYLDPHKDFFSTLYDVQLFFPVVLVAIYCLNRYCKGACRWIYYAALPVMLALLGICFNFLDDFCNSTAYPFTLLLAAFAFIAQTPYSENRAFSQKALRMVLNAIFSGVIGVLLYLAVAAIISSINYIFGLDILQDVLSRAFFFVAYIVVPLLFCTMQHADEQNPAPYSPSRFVEIALNYILNPAILIYVAIFYIYAFQILLAWELPKGRVAYMVLAFIIASFAGMMSQLIVRKPIYSGFYRHFTWIALPPLCLFWVGLAFRISTYGFTESRVYLAVAGVLMTAFVFFLLWKRLANFRLMLAVASAAIIVFTYIPGISAKALGLQSQIDRVRQLASELNLLDSATGKLKGTSPDFAVANEGQRLAAWELCMAYSYVEYADSITALAKLGKNKLIASNYVDPKSTAQTGRYVAFSLTGATLADISGYSKVVLYSKIDGDSVIVDGKPFAKLPPQEHLAQFASKLNDWQKSGASSYVSDPEPFTYRTDSCMMIFNYIEKTDSGWNYAPNSDIMLFIK